VAEPPATFRWKPWDEVQVRPYFKPSYYALQREWENAGHSAGAKPFRRR